MTQTHSATVGDYIRQSINLLGSPLMWLCSSLGLFIAGARSPAGISDLTPNPLVPWTPAFSIWLPIFIGCFAYGIVQALPKYCTRPMFRETGWWTAIGFSLVCLWGLVTAFAPDSSVEILASVVFIPTMLCLVVAMVKLTQRKPDLSGSETWTVLIPISLIAGWCSIAIFVGWNAVIYNAVKAMDWSLVGTSLMVLSFALGWAIVVLRRGTANKAYAFQIVWGLGFLAIRHLVIENDMQILGGAAVVGMVAVVIAATLKTQPQTSA